MGCGNLFFTLVITLSAALITYNIIISANASLKQEFPGPSNPSLGSSSFSVDPIIRMPRDTSSSASKKTKRLFHTAVTASDSIYNTWQCRVMYYWFKKQKNKPNSEMGGFTRILHSGKSDRFMDEIPTFIAQPLPSGMDQVFVLFFNLSIILVLLKFS
ncbi:hydroxyproline O-arabinosyltransferase 1-like [Olea europaea var. sylvestris]|uniref:hydroxyproline O-arabinosyltransferase 1-like n=1 Tax=Olea europaea var. sylvestris TaxID=158386 RepID=UPI000C1D7A25|nr:hydroxyproline O-arabinosyltransferase 1-like [Olea europaea var. sylvestris]